MKWFKRLFKKPEPELTPEQVNRAILVKLHNLNGDILCIMEKQIILSGMGEAPLAAETAQKGERFFVVNAGNHEWVCNDCGFPIQECREAQSQKVKGG